MLSAYTPRMVDTKRAVIESFDRIAAFGTGSWNHNNHYHDYLLRRLPQGRETVLDVGSGLGDFSRVLSLHFTTVHGIDFSPRMVELAAAQSASYANVSYTCKDFLEARYRDASYDAVVSVATLHHLPLREALDRMKRILRPGGRLLILDLYAARSPADFAVSAAGMLANQVVRRVRAERGPIERRLAWKDHGRLDRYTTLRQLRSACRDLLPGAVIRRHIYFRYSLIWEKR